MLKEGKPLSAIPVAVSHKQVMPKWKRGGHPHQHLHVVWKKEAGAILPGASSLTRPLGRGEGAARQPWPFPHSPLSGCISLLLHSPAWALLLLLTFTEHNPLNNSVPWTGQQTPNL